MASKKTTDFSEMIVTIKVPMPPVFKEFAKEFKDKAQIDIANKTVLIGDKVSGFIHAEKGGLTKAWIARGEGDLQYERKFGRFDKIDLVVSFLAEELVYMKLTTNDVKDYVTRYDIKGKNLMDVSFGDTIEEMHFNTPDNGR